LIHFLRNRNQVEMSSSFIPRGFVRSWKDLAQHLRWNIQEGKVKHLEDWFYHHRAPMYLPRDLEKLEETIFDFTQTKFHPESPTLRQPYYRYLLNPETSSNTTKKYKHPQWYLIYWPPKVRSQPHSHPLGGCVWWLLEGQIQEIIHSSPESKIVTHKRDFGQEQICVPNIASHPHQMINGRRESISLHCYWNGLRQVTTSNTHHHTK